MSTKFSFEHSPWRLTPISQSNRLLLILASTFNLVSIFRRQPWPCLLSYLPLSGIWLLINSCARVKVKVILQLTASRPACLGVRLSSGRTEECRLLEYLHDGNNKECDILGCYLPRTSSGTSSLRARKTQSLVTVKTEMILSSENSELTRVMRWHIPEYNVIE
jgi:hypothetical protein